MPLVLPHAWRHAVLTLPASPPPPFLQALAAPLAALRAQLSGAHLSGPLGTLSDFSAVERAAPMDVDPQQAALAGPEEAEGLRVLSSSSLPVNACSSNNSKAEDMGQLLGMLQQHGLIACADQLPLGTMIEVRVLTPAAADLGDGSANSTLPSASSGKTEQMLPDDAPLEVSASGEVSPAAELHPAARLGAGSAAGTSKMADAALPSA